MLWFQNLVRDSTRASGSGETDGRRGMRFAFCVELLLFGTGSRVAIPPPPIRQYLSKIGIQADYMDTVSLTVISVAPGLCLTSSSHYFREMHVPRLTYLQKKADASVLPSCL